MFVCRHLTEVTNYVSGALFKFSVRVAEVVSTYGRDLRTKNKAC